MNNTTDQTSFAGATGYVAGQRLIYCGTVQVEYVGPAHSRGPRGLLTLRVRRPDTGYEWDTAQQFVQPHIP